MTTSSEWRACFLRHTELQPRDIISGIQVATGDLGLAGALRVQASDCDSNASTAHCVSQLHYLHTTTRTTVSSLSLSLSLSCDSSASILRPHARNINHHNNNTDKNKNTNNIMRAVTILEKLSPTPQQHPDCCCSLSLTLLDILIGELLPCQHAPIFSVRSIPYHGARSK